MSLSTFHQNTRAALALDNVTKTGANKKTAGFWAILAIVLVALMPEVAMAAPWDGAANQVLAMLNSGLTRTLAIIAVVACGIAAMAGKLQWSWAINIIVGIVLVFGAVAVVDFFISSAS